MYVYIIQVEQKDGSFFKISQEGYKNLSCAQAFIEDRFDCPMKRSEFLYETIDRYYKIIEVKVV